MTAPEATRADEDHPHLDNLNGLSEVPMEVDEKGDDVVPAVPQEKDPREVYEQKAQQFMKELHKFHENSGTPIVRHPKINGKDVDLYELYTEMTKLGGWVKVNTRDDWDELLDNLAFPKACVNAAVALKYIYIRYLDRYEKLHFLGEETERVDEDDEDVRQKKMNTRYLHNVPMSYNHAQHNVSHATRLAHKLSTDYYRPTQNERLFLSLLSPLPNEQNFALNVCMLISNEPVSTFVQLDKCPKLIDALLAHAGVYSHYSLREIFTEFYSNYRKHSLQTFWNDCLSDQPHIMELSFGDISESLDGEIVSLDDKESEGAQEAAHHELLSSFLNLKRGAGTQDYVGLRVQQIATILRNLSFVEENAILFAQSRTFLRFLVMCSNIRWNNLHHMALDVLGNIAEDIELADPVTDDLSRCLLSTVIDGLDSEDRGVIISCMEVLYKLCRRPSNEDYLYKAFDRAMYGKITSFLWLKDAMLVMYTLECMYALTNMGEKTCNGFVHVRGIMDSLVSLVTLEAKTFGQEGCILMCVVDKQQQGAVAALKTVAAPAVVAAPPQMITNSPVKVAATAPKPTTPGGGQGASVVTPQKVNARAQNPASGGARTPLTSKQSQQQAHQENEQNAHEWLRGSYEAGEVGRDRVEMQELYKLYVTAMSKLKRGGVVSPAFFPKVVKAVFGATAGPVKDQGSPFYTGIKARPQPGSAVAVQSVVAQMKPVQVTIPRMVTIPTNKPTFSVTPSQAAGGVPKPNTIIQQVTPDGTHVITTVGAVQAAAAANQQVNPPSSPALKVPVPTKSGMTITPVSGAVSKQQGPRQVIRTQALAPPPSAVPLGASTSAQAPSSLIKSLLANKVTTTTTTSVPASVLVGKSPVKTAPSVAQMPQFVVQEPQKSQFFINPTNSNAAAPPPAGAVAAASVIMSSVAAQSARPSASVPISNSSSKVLQVSPAKTLLSQHHPPLILSSPPATNNPTHVIHAPNAMNVRQVVQRQQMQKQKEMAQRMGMQMKAGMVTTVVTSAAMDSSQPPPLAPLSGGPSPKVTVLKINPTAQVGGTPVIIASVPPQLKPAEEATISLANQLDGMTPPVGGGAAEDEEEDAAKQQSKVTANKMLADLLDKKSDPPTFGEGTSQPQATTTGKRKGSAEGGAVGPATAKRKASEEPVKATPSAANLYAEMAASILEDDESVEGDEEETEEDISMEEEEQEQEPQRQQVTVKAGQSTVVATAQPQPQQVITLPLRQQIIMPAGGSQQQQQVIVTGAHQMGSAQTGTATVKTESGYQTVPIIMQPQPQGTVQASVAGQQQQGPGIMQQRSGTTAVHAGQTQYVLATNPQGQTYVVATQSPMQQQMQTLLVTQTPQQQGTQQKTIIILQQQQPNQGAGGQGATTTPIQQAINSQGQKIIMTTPQGQQVVMTGGAATAGGVTAVGGVQAQRQIVIQQHQGGGGGGGATPVPQKQIILSTGGQQQQQQQYVKAPAPMDAISCVDNIPQHVIKTSTGLQIKPVHMQTQPTPQQTIQIQGQKAVITSGQQQQQQSVIQGGTKPIAAQVAVQQPLHVTGTTGSSVAPLPLIPAASPVLTSSASSSPVPPPAASPKISVGLSTVTTSEGTITVTTTTTQVQQQQQPQQPVLPVSDNGVEIRWPYVCDWRGCARRRFKSADEVFYHACKAHVPDTLDFDAEIFCQWGVGPNLCDGKPRKRFSLMTHFQDRHCTEDKFAAAVQRRLEKGISTSHLTHPVTIIRDVTKDADSAAAAGGGTGTGAGVKKEEDGGGVTGPSAASTQATTTTGSTVKKAGGKPGTWQPTAEAVSIIKRREFKDSEFSKAWKDDNEGPVSISIRLTASLILRNLVTYSDVAKRMLKCHESHLSQIALSNVESSRTIAQVLYEMNDIHPV